MKNITIHNVRLGFACNSSSTHSLVLFPSKKEIKDNDVESAEFGWDFFTAASQNAKTDYLAVLLRDTLAKSLHSQRAAQLVSQQLIGRQIPDNAYIDHQSSYTLPLNWDGKAPHEPFLKELTNFFMQDQLAILGGNDNSKEKHPLFHKGLKINLPLPRESHHIWVARKDEQFQYWTLFNRNNGAKIRFSFETLTTKPKPIKKATFPELVDIKITGFCPIACPYCYQASSPTQPHASKDYISPLAYLFEKMNVFEVALGGGEPTLHPAFWEIVQTFSHYNIIPNFTTKNITWLHNPETRQIFLEHCGSCAHSVTSYKEVEKLVAIIKLFQIPSQKFSIQVIDGVSNLYNILPLCHRYNLRLTLLGFKKSGLGSHFEKEHAYRLSKGYWINYVKEAKKQCTMPAFGIDTVIAQQYAKELKELNIPEYLYNAEEGKFSMYIDAVTKTAAPSSYCEAKDFQPLTDDYGQNFNIPEIFASF